MAAFSDGTAQTLVATDIAARGIHVDDIALVIHADPPIEHKAYLHRSGRTARAGADGTVITLMTDDQVRDVRDLTRKAGISPTTTRLDADHPLLRELAPGERTFSDPVVLAAPVQERPQGNRGPGRGSSRGGAPRTSTGGSGRGGSGRGGSGSGGRQGAGREAAACRCRRVTRRWGQALRYGAHRWPLRLDHGLHLDLGWCRGVLRRHPRRFGPRRSLTPARTRRTRPARTTSPFRSAGEATSALSRHDGARRPAGSGGRGGPGWPRRTRPPRRGPDGQRAGARARPAVATRRRRSRPVR